MDIEIKNAALATKISAKSTEGESEFCSGVKLFLTYGEVDMSKVDNIMPFFEDLSRLILTYNKSKKNSRDILHFAMMLVLMKNVLDGLDKFDDVDYPSFRKNLATALRYSAVIDMDIEELKKSTDGAELNALKIFYNMSHAFDQSRSPSRIRR